MPKNNESISHWNYRLVKKDGQFILAEVYYRNKKPILVGLLNQCDLSTESTSTKDKQELKADLKLMLTAFDKPVLDYKKIGKDKEPKDFLVELFAERLEKDKNFDKKLQKAFEKRTQKIVTELKEFDEE